MFYIVKKSPNLDYYISKSNYGGWPRANDVSERDRYPNIDKIARQIS